MKYVFIAGALLVVPLVLNAAHEGYKEVEHPYSKKYVHSKKEKVQERNVHHSSTARAHENNVKAAQVKATSSSSQASMQHVNTPPRAQTNTSGGFLSKIFGGGSNRPASQRSAGLGVGRLEQSLQQAGPAVHSTAKLYALEEMENRFKYLQEMPAAHRDEYIKNELHKLRAQKSALMQSGNLPK